MTNEEHDTPTPSEPINEASAAPDPVSVPADTAADSMGDQTPSIESSSADPLVPSAMKTATKDATAGGWFWGTGRRKASVARVRVRPGDGTFMVNKRPMTTLFTEERDHQDLMNVLETTRTTGQVEIQCNVRGGGYTGQSGAILLGLGRALLNYDSSLEPILREHGFLTRDPRRVERKKPGQPGARKRFQFSKR